MTDKDIQFKILDSYKELFAKERKDAGWINYFIEEFNINPFDLNSFIKPIENLKQELEKKKIPEPIETKSITTDNVQRFVKIYKDHTEQEADDIRTEWININQHLRYLKEMLSITKLYSLSVDEKKESERNKKAQRDTRSIKNKFMKSFLENSSKYKMNNGKIIAKLNKVSPASVTRYFEKLTFVNEIFDELTERYTTLSELKCNIESGIRSQHSHESTVNKLDNVEFNFIYVRDIKEKLQRKIIPKASSELSKTKRNSILN